jgi:hypothetical protein
MPIIPERSNPPKLLVPQARVLSGLYDGSPFLTREKMSLRAGYTAISGTVTRALNGLREGSSSGAAHRGIIDLGYVRAVEIDVDGATELAYQITDAGRAALEKWLADGNALPELRDKESATNKRYAKVD